MIFEKINEVWDKNFIENNGLFIKMLRVTIFYLKKIFLMLYFI